MAKTNNPIDKLTDKKQKLLKEVNKIESKIASLSKPQQIGFRFGSISKRNG